jgi:hypothetical protein
MKRKRFGGYLMTRAKDDVKRIPYSVKLDPDLITKLKHRAVDERKTMGELIEEAIRLLLQDETDVGTKTKPRTVALKGKDKRQAG